MSDEVVSTEFDRNTVARSTVARRCREYFYRRLERTEVLQRRWSLCNQDDNGLQSPEVQDSKDVGSDSSDSPVYRKCLERDSESSAPSENDSGNASDSSESPPCDFRKSSISCGLESPPTKESSRSSLDAAMDNLRREITSLIAQDNDLFRQLLSLNDSIAELRVQQEKNISLWNIDSESDEEESLESLSDPETASTVSPASTLSSCCSSHHLDNANTTSCRRGLETSWTRAGRQVAPSDCRQRTHSVLCLRCHGKGAAPLYRRRAASTLSLRWRSSNAGDELDSYDSGIHIHSDSDHEIFV